MSELHALQHAILVHMRDNPEDAAMLMQTAIAGPQEAVSALTRQAAQGRLVYRAMYDAAPLVRLTRTDPPTEPGWYWARIRNEDYRPEPLAVFRAGDALVVSWGVDPSGLDGFDWFGPLDMPEVSP